MSEFELFKRLTIALFAGFLVGVERGWAERAIEEGKRVAGIRTFGLMGFLGALSALLAHEFGVVFFGFAFASFTLMIAASYWLERKKVHDYGITTEVAAILTYCFGAVAMQGYLTVAAGGAVITAFILGMKPRLHELLSKLGPNEIYGTLKLLLISVVLLPVLPNRGYGPWAALNPYEIWWMVVLIASISFVGYVAMKLAGTRRGLLLTAVTGGLASSTAVALNYARLGRKRPQMHVLLAASVIAASSTMFPRMLLVGTLVQPDLFQPFVLPLATMALAGIAMAAWYARSSASEVQDGEMLIDNPFEIKPALQFGLLLALIMVLAKALQASLGDLGIYVLAAVSGLSDVDAITLSLGRLSHSDLALDVAAAAIVLAALVNTAVKALIVIVIGGGKMARIVGAGSAVLVLVGALTMGLSIMLGVA